MISMVSVQLSNQFTERDLTGSCFGLALAAVLMSDSFSMAVLMPSMVLAAPTPMDSIAAAWLPVALVSLILFSVVFINSRTYLLLCLGATLLLKLAVSALVWLSLSNSFGIESTFVLDSGGRLLEVIFFSGLIFSIGLLALEMAPEQFSSDSSVIGVKRNSPLPRALVILSVSWIYLVLSLSSGEEGWFARTNNALLPFVPWLYAGTLVGLTGLYLLSNKSGAKGSLFESVPDLSGKAIASPHSDRYFPVALLATVLFLFASPYATSLLLSAWQSTEIYNFSLAISSAFACGLVINLCLPEHLRQSRPGITVGFLSVALFADLFGLFLSRWTASTVALLFIAGALLSSLVLRVLEENLVKAKDFVLAVVVAIAVTYPAAAFYANSAMVLPPAYVIQPLALLALVLFTLISIFCPLPRKVLLSRIAAIFLWGAGRKDLLLKQFKQFESLSSARIESQLSAVTTILVSLYLRCPLTMVTRDGFLHMSPVKAFLAFLSVKIAASELSWGKEKILAGTPELVYYGKGYESYKESRAKGETPTKADYLLGSRKFAQGGPRYLTLVVERPLDLVAEKL